VATFTSFAAFGRQLELMQREIDATADRKILLPMAEKAQKIGKTYAAGHVGADLKFSGWAPTLVTEIKVANSAVIVHPTRQSAGPWTVSERGRNQGNASGFAGPGINRRSGLTSRTKSGGIRKQRMRQTKRWNGVTEGRQTATRAQAHIDRVLPPVGEAGFRKIARKHFDVS
jgi:hypothetical protein